MSPELDFYINSFHKLYMVSYFLKIAKILKKFENPFSQADFQNFYTFGISNDRAFI